MGNVHPQSILVEAVPGGFRNKKGSYFKDKHRRLQARQGKRANVSIARCFQQRLPFSKTGRR